MWLDIIKELYKELKERAAKKTKKKDELYDAIEAVNKAANRTTIYITKSLNGTYKSDQELSDLWMDAAKAVRELDDDLYLRLLAKAEYWSNPQDWSDEDVQSARITLEEIKKGSKELINKDK